MLSLTKSYGASGVRLGPFYKQEHPSSIKVLMTIGVGVKTSVLFVTWCLKTHTILKKQRFGIVRAVLIC